MNVSEAIDIAEQCRDYLANERDINGDDSGKLTDFVNALSILLDSQLGASIVLDALFDAGDDARLSEVKIQRAGMTEPVWLTDVLRASKPQRLPKADEALAEGHAPTTVCLSCERMRRVCDVAKQVVSRAIHRRQDHREIVARQVELLPLDIEILAKLAAVVEAMGGNR